MTHTHRTAGNGMVWTRTARLALRMLLRSRARAVLAILGIAVAVFLLCAERALHAGVREATEANDRDTRLIVYRANRFCPFTSRLPEHYTDAIREIPGVASAVPMQIAVSNCRASLDVVVFRGVRADDAERVLGPRLRFVDGSMAAFLARGDGALVGSALAERRRLKVGDRFASAGVTVTVAGIVEAEGAQDRNACFVQLPFLQGSVGGVQGGEVTQFEVEVGDPRQMEEVARAIDERFATDASPTSTRAEKAFVARAAQDLVVIARFAGWVGLAALVAVFALVANAIVLSLEGRMREIAVLQSVGYRAGLVAWMIVAEAVALAAIGSLLGAGAAFVVLALGRFSLGAEGVLVEFRPSLGAALAATAAAVAVGLVAGALPAFAAARRSIVEGLRSA
jgi:putative ABC transport system permease protein